MGHRRGVDSARERMVAGFTLGNDLLLVADTDRLFREGKATIARALSVVFVRLGSAAGSWQARLLKPSEGCLLGRCFASSRQRSKDMAERLGVRHLANFAGCLSH